MGGIVSTLIGPCCPTQKIRKGLFGWKCLVYSESYHICLLITTRTNQSRDYAIPGGPRPPHNNSGSAPGLVSYSQQCIIIVWLVVGCLLGTETVVTIISYPQNQTLTTVHV